MTTTPTRRVTLTDVARHCGVSIATVSYVVNGGKGTIGDATRERVRAAAVELGYRPNTAAATLRRGHSNLVLLVLPGDLEGPALRELVSEVEAAHASADQAVLMHAFRTPELLLATTWTVQPKLVVLATDVAAGLAEQLREAGAAEVVTTP